MKIKKLYSEFQTWRSNFIQHHETVNCLTGALVRLEYHLGRGKGFWGQWIDYGNYLLKIFLAAASLEILGFSIKDVIGRDVVGFSVSFVFGVMFLFFVTSMVMDFVKYTEKQMEQSNNRNWLAIELRNIMRVIKEIRDRVS